MDPLTMDPLTMQANVRQARRDADRLRLEMEATRAGSGPYGGHEDDSPSAPSGLIRALASFTTFRAPPSSGTHGDRPSGGDASAADRLADPPRAGADASVEG